MSMGSSAKAAAALSIRRSMANVITGRETPRYGAIGHVWVATPRETQAYSLTS
jgi:hypothetical protein